MLQISSTSKIFIHLKPVDFRKGMDGLAAICRNELKINPFSGAIFVFRNRKQTALKLLVYDGQGFWVCHKRLSQGKLYWWPSGHEQAISLSSKELQTLLINGDLKSNQFLEEFKKLP